MQVKNTTISSWKRVLHYATRYKVRLALGIIAGFLAGGSLYGLLNLSPYVLKPFDQAPVKVVSESSDLHNVNDKKVDKITKMADEVADKLGIDVYDSTGRMTWQFVVLTLMLLPIIVASKVLTVYLNRYYMRWVGARVTRDLRNSLFNCLQSQSLTFFGKSDIGKLISKCTNDTSLIEQMFAQTIADATRAPIEVLFAILFVIIYSIDQHMLKLVLVTFFVFPICILPIIVLGRYLRKYMHRALDQISFLVSRMHENFTGIRVVKAFHMEEKEQIRFDELNKKYFRSIIKALRVELLMTPFMEGFATLLGCIFFVVCFAKGVQLSDIFPIGVAAIVLYKPFKQLAKINANLQRGSAALDRVFEILDTDTALKEAEKPIVVNDFKDKLVLESISFRYEEDGEMTVDDISIEIKKGSVIAVVGETGSGKTTLANLLARFYDPTAGRILMDGVDLREIEIASLRKMVGVVTQDTILFNDTIADNIAYGTEDASRDQIISAAKKANAHEFISAAPEGYERMAGEKGFVLSGGEKQRIAIARAILKNPPILILDEATSALDTVTERLVQDAISKLMEERTVFAIAHRLSTIKHADQILLMEKGRIVERGTHAELYNAGGRYSRLCNMQVMD